MYKSQLEFLCNLCKKNPMNKVIKILSSVSILGTKAFKRYDDAIFEWCGYNNTQGQAYLIQQDVLSVIPDKEFVDNFDSEDDNDVDRREKKIKEIKDANKFFVMYLVNNSDDTEGFVVDYLARKISAINYIQWNDGDEAEVEVSSVANF